MNLQELQTHFLAGLYQDAQDATITQVITPSAKLTPAQAYHVYQNSIRAILIKGLRHTFSVCDKLVGNEFFDAMAESYIQQHPSTTPDIGLLGKNFADFIAKFAPAKQLPYLADVVRLEWLWLSAANGPDLKPLDFPALLTALQSPQSEQVVIHLPANAYLLESAYPIKTIWEFAQQTDITDQTLDISQGGGQWLIWRPAQQVVIENLTDSECAFVKLVANGLPFGDLCEQLQQAGHDVGILLPHAAQRGWVNNFTIN
ncbi:MAG: putative DNA-binding domain-containing protein [Gammaproteobacteria bacterium]